MVDILAPITPGGDVVEGISEFKTQRAGTCVNSSRDVILKDLTPVVV